MKINKRIALLQNALPLDTLRILDKNLPLLAAHF